MKSVAGQQRAWGAHTIGLTPTELRPPHDAEAALQGEAICQRGSRPLSATSALPARPVLTAAARARCCQPFRTTVGPACAPRPTIAFRSPAHSSERQQRLILEPRSCRETRGRCPSRAPSQNAPPAGRAMASRHLISAPSGHLLDSLGHVFTPGSETHMCG